MHSESNYSPETYRKRLSKRPEIDTIFGPNEVALVPELDDTRIYTDRPEGIYIVLLETPAVADLVSFLDSALGRAAGKHTVRVPTRKAARTLYKHLQGCACMLETRIMITHETDTESDRFVPELINDFDNTPDTTAARRFLRRYTDECDADGDADHRTEVDEANNDNETNEADEASEADDRIARERLVQRFALWFTNRRLGPTPTAPEAAQALGSVARFSETAPGLGRALQNRCWSVPDDDESSERQEMDE